jgi:hypothetical protein
MILICIYLSQTRVRLFSVFRSTGTSKPENKYLYFTIFWAVNTGYMAITSYVNYKNQIYNWKKNQSKKDIRCIKYKETELE